MAACLVLAVGVVALWRFRPVDVLEGDATASSALPKGGENVYGGGRGGDWIDIDGERGLIDPDDKYALGVILRSQDREIVDFYYQELCEKFPDYTRIPAKSLWANFERLPDGNFVVGFCFNLRGGYHAGCVREYHSDRCEWGCSDTGFSAYFEKGFTREEIINIRAALIAQIQERLAKDKLKVREGYGAMEEQMQGVEWTQSGGKLYAQAWLIAYPAGSSYAEEDRVCIEARVELGDTTVESAVYNVPGTPPRAEWLFTESGTVSSAAG